MFKNSSRRTCINMPSQKIRKHQNYLHGYFCYCGNYCTMLDVNANQQVTAKRESTTELQTTWKTT